MLHIYRTVNGSVSGKSKPFRMRKEKEQNKQLEEKCKSVADGSERQAQMDRDFTMKICLEKGQTCTGGYFY